MSKFKKKSATFGSFLRANIDIKLLNLIKRKSRAHDDLNL